MCKNSLTGDRKNFETGTWMLKHKKQKQHHKHHFATLCETFDNRMLSTLTELARAANSRLSHKIINEHFRKKALLKMFSIGVNTSLKCHNTLLVSTVYDL